MPTPNELDAIFAENRPLSMAPSPGGYQPQLGQEDADELAWQGRIAPLMKPIGGGRTPGQIAADDKLFATPSASSLAPQLQGGQQGNLAQPSSDGSGWQDLFAGIADAGAALQGRQGASLQNLFLRRQNQAELQQKQEQEKQAQLQKRFEFMVKTNENSDPDVRKRMMKAARQAGVITEQDEAVLSKVPSGKLKSWAPRLEKESPAIWKSYQDGDLPDAIVNELIKQQESRDAEEFALKRIPELQKEQQSGSISPTNRAMLDYFEKTYGPQLLKVQQEREALDRAQRENRIGAATEDQARLQAILKTTQEANTLAQQLPGGVQYQATQQAAAHNKRLAEQPRIERVPMGEQEAVVAFYPDGRNEIVSVGGQELKGQRKPGVEVNINPSAEERKAEAADRNYIQDLRRLGKMVKPDWVGMVDEKVGRLGQTAGILSRERETFIQANQALFTALRNKAFGATLTKEERKAAEDAFPNPKMQYEQYKASIDAWMRTYGRKIELAEVGRQLNAEQRQELDHLLNDPRFDDDSVYDMADYIQRNWKK